MKAVAHSPKAAARPASRWRLRGAAALMGAVLLTTSCWGTGSETPSSTPTVPSSPESSPPPTPPARITATWEVTVTEYGPNQPRTFHQGGTKQWSIDLPEEAREWF